MLNLREQLEAFEVGAGERLEAVVIGRRRGEDADGHRGSEDPVGREEALARLDYGYAAFIGSMDPPHPVVGWTRSHVVFLVGMLGEAAVATVLRNPGRCMPALGGIRCLGVEDGHAVDLRNDLRPPR